MGICVPAGAALLCLVVSVTGSRRERTRRRRCEGLLGRTGSATDPFRGKRARRVPSRSAPAVRDAVTRWGEPLGAGLAAWILVGGVMGALAGVGAAAAVRRLRPTGRTRRAAGSAGPDVDVASAADEASAARQLPLAADLLAACISAGAGPRQAAEAVGESLRGPLGERLVRAAVEIRLGGDPSRAWGLLGEIPGAGPLARCLDRAGETGAPAAEPVARLADAIRSARADAAVARAQRAGVLITAPVGLCFLPAFLAVGVAPVIVGLAGGILHAG
ncbi:type II secretion system F family protein [Streptomyces sp. NBC_00102]|uniref:type II secretion system F family protein n=1 Tax=Streptomyces sp. NBC_00102 TaxID=2975652 RepID=UPI0022517D14|nr:type II secretion system F family protein [Streptomyces sp. NBC_00102]MCX5398655.1 type II secretion system F family protein [Streptomyces sp. NBC_00102]